MAETKEPKAVGRIRRRRKFDMLRAKQSIVFWVGLLTGAGSALTGIGAQSAFAPMLTWMLGFREEKALATATRYAMFTSLTATIICLVAAPRQAPVLHAPLLLGQGVLIMIAATLGAAMAGPLASGEQNAGRRRLALVTLIIILLFVVVQTARLNTFSPDPQLANWRDPLRLAGLGCVIGVVARAGGVLLQLLLIPALYYLGGFTPFAAVTLSLLVTTLSSVLPALSYSKRGLIDTDYGNSAVFGGVLGGTLGAWLLTLLSGKLILISFALIGMFLCGRELARIAGVVTPMRG